MPTHTASPPKTKRPRPDFPPLPTPAVRWLTACGALLLIGACVFCARWGLADLVLAEASRKQIALQSHTARNNDAEEVRAVGEALLQAQRADPRNPGTAEQRGSHFALNVQDEASDGSIGSHWAKAREQYALAVALRPSSPYSWANIAWTKYHLGQVDKEFYRALNNAIRLGPWEPEVQFVIVDLGFALWEKMPVELRPKVLTIAQNGQNRYSTQIAAIAREHGRLAEVCKFAKLASKPVCAAIPG